MPGMVGEYVLFFVFAHIQISITRGEASPHRCAPSLNIHLVIKAEGVMFQDELYTIQNKYFLYRWYRGIDR